MTHRDNADELRQRIMWECRFGAPEPRVSPAVSILLAELYAELMACVLELELLRELQP